MPIYIVQHRRGTSQEWLKTNIKLREGELGIEYTDDNQTMARILIGTKNGVNALPFSSVIKIRTISLPASGWTGDTSPFAQAVTIDDVTANSKIDLQLTPQQLVWVQDNDFALTTENNNGTITVYAIGDEAPDVNFTEDEGGLGLIQVTISETV